MDNCNKRTCGYLIFRCVLLFISKNVVKGVFQYLQRHIMFNGSDVLKSLRSCFLRNIKHFYRTSQVFSISSNNVQEKQAQDESFRRSECR